MKKMVTQLYLLLFSFFFCGGGYAQTVEEKGWLLLKEKDGIQVYGLERPCQVEYAANPYDYLFLKVVNTGSEAKDVRIKVRMNYQEGCSGCNDSDENYIFLHLEASEIKEGNCDNHSQKLTRFIANPGFDGSWHYLSTEIIIN